MDLGSIHMCHWKKKKGLSRTQWRATHNMNKKRIKHGGRGKKYGLKRRKRSHNG